MSHARVLLMERPGCHLCEVAAQVVEIVCAEVDEDFARIDITDDPAAADLYSARVPVVVVDGQEVAQFRVDSQRLRSVLIGER